MLKHSNTVILDKDSNPDGMLLCRSNTNTGYSHTSGRIFFDVYEGRKVRFYDDSKKVLSSVYIEFRELLLEERKQQRKPDKLQGW
jgi:hypothetical protein